MHVDITLRKINVFGYDEKNENSSLLFPNVSYNFICYFCQIMTSDNHFSHNSPSMRYFHSDGANSKLKPVEENRWKPTDSIFLSHSWEEPQTNVIWVQNPLQQLINSENGSEMPTATIGSTHPNNEECGIRDVWAHNLEDEFKAIRQVTSYNLSHFMSIHFLSSCLFLIENRLKNIFVGGSKVYICCHGHRIPWCCCPTNW